MVQIQGSWVKRCCRQTLLWINSYFGMARLVQYGRLMRGIVFTVEAFQEAAYDRPITRLATPPPLSDPFADPFPVSSRHAASSHQICLVCFREDTVRGYGLEYWRSWADVFADVATVRLCRM